MRRPKKPSAPRDLARPRRMLCTSATGSRSTEMGGPAGASTGVGRAAAGGSGEVAALVGPAGGRPLGARRAGSAAAPRRTSSSTARVGGFSASPTSGRPAPGRPAAGRTASSGSRSAAGGAVRPPLRRTKNATTSTAATTRTIVISIAFATPTPGMPPGARTIGTPHRARQWKH